MSCFVIAFVCFNLLAPNVQYPSAQQKCCQQKGAHFPCYELYGCLNLACRFCCPGSRKSFGQTALDLSSSFGHTALDCSNSFGQTSNDCSKSFGQTAPDSSSQGSKWCVIKLSYAKRCAVICAAMLGHNCVVCARLCTGSVAGKRIYLITYNITVHEHVQHTCRKADFHVCVRCIFCSCPLQFSSCCCCLLQSNSAKCALSICSAKMLPTKRRPFPHCQHIVAPAWHVNSVNLA